MTPCLKVCIKKKVSCPCVDCRNHIDYEDDYNCVLYTVEKNPQGLSYVDTAERLGVTKKSVITYQQKALEKLLKRFNNSRFTDDEIFTDELRSVLFEDN